MILGQLGARFTVSRIGLWGGEKGVHALAPGFLRLPFKKPPKARPYRKNPGAGGGGSNMTVGQNLPGGGGGVSHGLPQAARPSHCHRHGLLGSHFRTSSRGGKARTASSEKQNTLYTELQKNVQTKGRQFVWGNSWPRARVYQSLWSCCPSCVRLFAESSRGKVIKDQNWLISTQGRPGQPVPGGGGGQGDFGLAFCPQRLVCVSLSS